MTARATLGLVAVLATAPAHAIDRWEYRSDDGSYTNNELQPGVVQAEHDLERDGQPDQDWYKVRIHDGRSYEVRVFGGAVVWKYPACPDCAQVDRVTSLGDVLTPGDAETTLGPPGLSVRWIAGPEHLEWLRVLPDKGSPGFEIEKYDILLVDTTLYLARFNNTSTQRTVVIIQNIHDRSVEGRITFHGTGGERLHVRQFSIVPNGSFVLDTSTISALAGQAGSATIAHTGGMSALVGKGVAFDPSTGYSFDTPLMGVPR